MDEMQQQQALYDQLFRVIDRFRDEFEISVASAIGVLEIIKLELYNFERESNK
jgi:hypothetical protein